MEGSADPFKHLNRYDCLVVDEDKVVCCGTSHDFKQQFNDVWFVVAIPIISTREI